MPSCCYPYRSPRKSQWSCSLGCCNHSQGALRCIQHNPSPVELCKVSAQSQVQPQQSPHYARATLHTHLIPPQWERLKILIQDWALRSPLYLCLIYDIHIFCLQLLLCI